MKQRFVEHTVYPFSAVFSERNTSQEVHAAIGEPLTRHALAGGRSTCMCYGQTGSGKTFTMETIRKVSSARARGGSGGGVQI